MSTEEEAKGWNVQLSTLMIALEKGMYLPGFLFVVAAYYCVVIALRLDIAIFYAVTIGLVAGMAIGKITE